MTVCDFQGCVILFRSQFLVSKILPARSTRKTGPIVDADRRVIGAYDAGPRDPTWQANVVEPAADLMEEAAAGIYDHNKLPRRGDYRSKTIGNSMGGGQEAPSPFFNILLHQVVLLGLLATEPFRRLAGHTNVIFQAYAPDLHGYYATTMNRLHQWNRKLKRNFLPTVSVFAAATFNFGPATVTLPHLDFANLAWGWCAVTALGNFDPDKGGHLILWDLMLIIRFPPGATIFLPSALLRHSNVAIQQGEKRFSFTQFTAAGIFRFVDNDFHTDREVNDSVLTPAEEAARVEARKTRWAEGLKMYKTWDRVFE
ncbi:hypothetical protein B0H16DRAFT_1316665 [Mycena metata]|uniref:Uncharacterized protein n=1 Tax=Mycena metata TaxID=1033252 RepID=A0AAD7J3Y2_9AGAR|nr:hypothetical protein B0H16DRAFT_1316665 [Mycena metata]